MKTTPVLLTALCTIALPRLADAGRLQPPPSVPDNIKVLAPNHLFFEGHGVGTQNYVCLPAATATGVAFKLFTPQATLFDDDFDKALTTHFFSPNPDEHGVIRATWQDSRDSSFVWAQVVDGDASTDEKFVARGAVAWLKLTVVGGADGPDGGDRLSKSTFIQRINTQGGLAPKTDCTSPTDIGHQAFVPYTADYLFYTDR